MSMTRRVGLSRVVAEMSSSVMSPSVRPMTMSCVPSKAPMAFTEATEPAGMPETEGYTPL